MRLPPPHSSTEEEFSGSSNNSLILWDIPTDTRNGRQFSDLSVIRPTPVRPYTPEPQPTTNFGEQSSLTEPHYEAIQTYPSSNTSARRRTNGFMPVVTINVPSVRTYQELARQRSVNRTLRPSPQPQRQHQTVYNVHGRHLGTPNREQITGIPRLVRNPLFNSAIEAQLIREREELNRSDPILSRFIQPSYHFSSNATQTADSGEEISYSNTPPFVTTAPQQPERK